MKKYITNLIRNVFFSFCILSFLQGFTQSTLQSTNFTSPALSGATIPVDIYLPGDYAATIHPFPLYIFLHGCCGNAPGAYKNLFKSRLDALIASGDVEPMLVVFPSIQGADFGNRHLFRNSVRNGNYGDAIVQDLIGFLNSNYKVGKDKKLRAIGGFSMGGDGAWGLGIAHPDSFGHILSHGAFPALDPFPGIFIPSFLQENGGSAPYNFSPSAGAFSGIVFGVSSTWSPNINSAPYQLDLPVKTDGNLDTLVFESWYPIADANTRIRQTWQTPQPIPTTFYFDVGRQVGLLLPANELLAKQIDTMALDGYSFAYKNLIFEEQHQMSQARIDSSLAWLSSQFKVTPSVSVDPVASRINVRVASHPQTDEIKISWNISIGESMQIQLLDIHGKSFYQTEVRPGTRQISVSMREVPAGVYVLRVNVANKNEVKKFLWN